MIKKMFVLLVILAFGYPHSAYAAESQAKNSSATDPKLEESYKKEKQKIAELEGTEWDVTLVSRDKDKTKEQDKLLFKNRTVNLNSFEKKGFPAVGYTVTPNEEGDGAKWENYQERKEGSLAMRGEWKEGFMNGAVGWTTGDEKDKKTRSYYFTSTLMKDNIKEEAQAAPKAKDENGEGSNVLVSKEKI